MRVLCSVSRNEAHAVGICLQVSGLGTLPYYIEVKTTTDGTKDFAEISANEVAMANEHRSQFVLLRLWGELKLQELGCGGGSQHVYELHNHVALPDPLFCGDTQLQLHGMLCADQGAKAPDWLDVGQ